MTEELLKAIHAKTNAIDAVNTALTAEWTIIESLYAEATKDTPDLDKLRDGLAELKALNSALPAAVVANVAPASAGPVGQSPKEQVFEQADSIVAEGLARVAEASKSAGSLAEHLQRMFNDLQTSAQAIAAAKTMKAGG